MSTRRRCPHCGGLLYETKDLTSQRFGRLVVLRRHGKRGSNRTWVCRCDCGVECIATTDALHRGQKRSCGCLYRETVRLNGLANVRHGHARSTAARHPLYARWCGMRDRCKNPNHQHYRHYGGRGIKVCARWVDFTAFLADVGTPPGPKYTLDRINNDGDYEPGNVRWATSREQVANSRRYAR